MSISYETIPDPHELIDLPNVSDDLIDAPEEYDYQPRYGVPTYLDSAISWVTVPVPGSNHLTSSASSWVSWFVCYCSSLITNAYLTLSAYMFNSVIGKFNNYSQLRVKNWCSTKPVNSPLARVKPALSLRKRE